MKSTETSTKKCWLFNFSKTHPRKKKKKKILAIDAKPLPNPYLLSNHQKTTLNRQRVNSPTVTKP